MLSITIPIYNEEESIPLLHAALVKVLEGIGKPFEIILVNDGSSDGSEQVLKELADRDPRVKVITFRRNFGQTAAMMAGIDHASGDIIIPMDGDMQNDPADIPKLLAKLDEGYDVVSGWRRDRKDHSIKRNFPSRVANALISWISGVHLHDYGCSLKGYRRDVLKGVKLYGEMHRFIPIYASWEGGKVAEVPVAHHARVHGRSKYGMERVIKVILDLIVVKFLARYSNKPIYVFGGFGIFAIFVAFLAGVWAVYLKLVEGVSFILTPLPLLVVMLSVTGGMSVLMGLLAEIIMRTYYEAQDKPVYQVRSTLNLDKEAR
ncbi:glycosyltransferase family 2 protein [Usitatibacter palustris]|uniref:Dodecaprenyl-phosphate galacturonate synthase n=1 Tax=Usitatibacter palustris TaxID=2732487 RepID=A0A6M4HBL8_9PROT|nr:glycosyltransferase family 2 protein [Usitatibacter palustris]QJR16495.1 Dodecaprenyl-phosphate galacturonate synthase [Usitatibacter palustris]